MDQKMYQYYLNCWFLWHVSSAADLLLEDVDSSILNQRFRTGYDEFEDLAGWLLDELKFTEKREGIDVIRSEAIQYKVGKIVLEYVDVVRAKAQAMGKHVRERDSETWLYYLTCGWSLQASLEFDSLLKDIGAPDLWQRYQGAHAKFEHLAEWLQNELSWVVGRPGVSEEEAKALQAAMEALTDQLAAEWREKVYELAKA
jgi:hypothetical protein